MGSNNNVPLVAVKVVSDAIGVATGLAPAKPNLCKSHSRYLV